MKYKEKRVYKHMPAGWKVEQSANNHPVGTKWISNGKSRFPKNGKPSERKQALLVTDEKAMIRNMATNRRRGRTDGFATDKTTETKVQAEIRRQNRTRAASKLRTSKAPVRTTRTAAAKTSCRTKPAATKTKRTVRRKR